ncbi:hypothetical protein PIB30_079684, partial [Stylosanthes scabra]|nr:hypothetical protein [Stylosanthes scabra]
MGINGQKPLDSIHSLLPFEEERKERDEMRVGGGGGHYSPPTSGGHNFHTEAPIDAPFAATHS